MKKGLVAFAYTFMLLLCDCSPDKPKPVTEQVKAHLLAQFDSLQTIAAGDLLRLAVKGSGDSIKIAFHRSRNAYKQIEWFTEYYAPTASRELNGAPLPEIEIEETTTFPPSGFQVMEEYVYPRFEEENRPELIREVKSFLSTFKRTRVILEETEFTEAHIIDACKQQIFRGIVLGISGFDTPLSQTGVQETAHSLGSVRQALSYFGENPRLSALFEEAIGYIQQQQDFNAFDRMAFITRFAHPITIEMLEWQRALAIEPLKTSLALHPQAATLFDKDAINTNHFAGNLEAKATPEKIAIGKDLFFNPVISGSSTTCASCHKPELAFTDGLPKSAALTAGKFVKRNAPTLFYAGLQHAQFYDMRSPTLENQAMDVIANKDEMHASIEEAAARLNEKPAYVKAFKTAFPAMEEDIWPRHVMMGIASYIRSLAPFNSRFDKYVRGDYTQLNAEEVKGFNLFMGKGKCGTCHFVPVFNGTAAPAFTNTEAEVLGVPLDPKAKKPVIDTDQGRYFHNKINELKFSFKTPTLRNVAKTAPYMHNGSFGTLEEVMDFYNQGGGEGIGIPLNNQTLSPDPLDLTEEEEKAIIAFLNALTDEELTQK